MLKRLAVLLAITTTSTVSVAQTSVPCSSKYIFQISDTGEVTHYENLPQVVTSDCATRKKKPKTLKKIPSVPGEENLKAARMHKVLELRDFYDLSGEGVIVGVWDGGIALEEHVEFGKRVSTPSAFDILNNHATHVIGTIVASGIEPEAAGMAPGVHVKSFSFAWPSGSVSQYPKVTTEMSAGFNKDITVSNHSYGIPGGWSLRQPLRNSACQIGWHWDGHNSDTEDWHFGKYYYSAQNIDEVIYRNPQHSAFFAAGNEGTAVTNPEVDQHRLYGAPNFTGRYCVFDSIQRRIQVSNKRRNTDLAKNRYDTLTAEGLSKNAIIVGAAIDLGPGFKDSEIDITNFSSVGGADDGRVKPDVIANGFKLYSTTIANRCNPDAGGHMCPALNSKPSEREEYDKLSGTSMATPVVTGIGALLNELSIKQQNRERMLFADEMRVLLTHTSRSPTSDGAPSYRYGWGLVDALASGELLSGQDDNSLFERITLETEANPHERSITWSNKSKALRITGAWIDPPFKVLGHDARTTKLNDTQPVLVRDVDIKLVAPNGLIYFPWKLSMDVMPPERAKMCIQKPDADRTCTPNVVDNLERIDLPASQWQDGEWKIVIDTSKVKLKPFEGKTIELTLAKSEVEYQP